MASGIKKYYKYFTKEELQCHGENCCDHTMILNDNFMTAMMHLRAESGGAIFCSSYFRCEKHNAEIGGVANSFHKKAQAMDCVSEKLTLIELANLADKYFNEVLLYDTFVHIADLKNPYDTYM